MQILPSRLTEMMSVKVPPISTPTLNNVPSFDAMTSHGVRLWHVRREDRVHPLKDDKIITAWNGLMIAALAKGGQALGEAGYTEAAARAADFVLAGLRTEQGHLMRRYRQGHVAHQGYLDDYAFMVWGLIELYEAAFDPRYLEEALALNRIMLELFWDDKAGGLYFAGRENEALITRKKEVYDGALPSGNSAAALNLLRLSRMTGETGLEEKAEALMRSFSNQVNKYPTAHTHSLTALDFLLGPGREIVIAGDPGHETTRTMAGLVHRRFMPDKVLLLRQEGEAGERLAALSPFVGAMKPIDGQPTAYICREYACQKPISEAGALEEALDD